MFTADHIPGKAMGIYAHPDDAEFTVAGTLSRWARGGCEVTLVSITSGNSGTHDTRFTRESLARTREEEARASARVLGISRVVFLGHGDCELVPTMALRRELVRQIRTHRPEVVLCNDPQALFFENRYINHPDHRAAGQAALDAAFPCSEMELLWPEEGPAHAVRAVYVSSTHSPNTVIDITDTIDLKIAALREHGSQLGERDPSEMIRAWGMREAARIPEVAAAGGSVPGGKGGGSGTGPPAVRYAESFRVMILKPSPPRE
ncbi:MAG: PIG-L family deacetylase [Deltaproteobacteria bacterium]